MIRGAGEHRRGRADREDRMEEGDIGTREKEAEKRVIKRKYPRKGCGDGLWHPET